MDPTEASSCSQALLPVKNSVFYIFSSFLKNIYHRVAFSRKIQIIGSSVILIGVFALTVWSLFSPIQTTVKVSWPDDPVIGALLGGKGSGLIGQNHGESSPAFLTNEQELTLKTLTYVIQGGDTLSSLSGKFGVSVRTLIGFNKIESARRLKVGQKITIPNIDGIPHQVVAGETLETLAENYQTTVAKLLDANDLATSQIFEKQVVFIPGAMLSDFEYNKVVGTLFIYPCANWRLTSRFGMRQDPIEKNQKGFHYGIDLASKTNSRVVASMAGRVYQAGYQSQGLGKYVILRHVNGFKTLYAHLNKISVQKGEWVGQGKLVGLMGSTGRSTGSHVHFSIYKNNKAVDPLLYLKKP